MCFACLSIITKFLCTYSLQKQYVTQVKHLCQTGAGLEASDDDITENHEVCMDFYISPEGPDEGTEERAKNLWGG